MLLIYLSSCFEISTIEEKKQNKYIIDGGPRLALVQQQLLYDDVEVVQQQAELVLHEDVVVEVGRKNI